MKNSRSQKKYYAEMWSAASSLTMIAAIFLLVKYHNHWKLVLAGIVAFLIGLLVLAYVISQKTRKKNIEKALLTKQYDDMSGIEFERFCADVLRGNGYKDVKVTQASGDHGIDVLAEKDGKKYAIQCKRYSKPVGNKAVQEAYSGKDIYKADFAIVMTNQSFTKQAIEDAKNLGVELWDRDRIYELQKAGLVSIKGNSEEEKVEDELICPQCGGKLVLRTAKKGQNAGKQFYGCSNYPNCKYTKDFEN